MDVFPDFGGVGAAEDLRVVIGALLMFVLIIAVLVTWLTGVSERERASASGP